MCGLQGDNIVTLRGHQWVPGAEIDILVNDNLVHTLTDPNWFWQLDLSFTNPTPGDYLIEAVSATDNHNVTVALPCTAVTATPTITKTPYATLTSTPTHTAVPPTATPTATPSTPYIIAANLSDSPEVTLQGFNWPSDEDIEIYYEDQLIATIQAGHGGSFSLTLTLDSPPTHGAELRASSLTASHTTLINIMTVTTFDAYLPFISKPVTPPPTATPTATPTVPPTATATATSEAPTNDPRAYINQYRTIAGVPAVNFGATLDDNCWQHARYMAENNDLTHDQDSNLPYASDAGQICAVNGNVWLGGAFSTPYWQPTDSINGWLSSVGHRLWLLYPTTPTFGYGFYTAETNRVGGALDVLSTFNSSADAGYDGWPVRYPAAQQSGIPATDYAITLQWPYFGPIPIIDSTSLTTLGGDPVAHTATTELPVGHKGIVVRSGAALPNDTVFEVTMTGTYNGEPFSHSWQFGTGNAVP